MAQENKTGLLQLLMEKALNIARWYSNTFKVWWTFMMTLVLKITAIRLATRNFENWSAFGKMTGKSGAFATQCGQWTVFFSHPVLIMIIIEFLAVRELPSHLRSSQFSINSQQ